MLKNEHPKQKSLPVGYRSPFIHDETFSNDFHEKISCFPLGKKACVNVIRIKKAMARIYESEHFSVDAEDNPLIGRSEGGHITINPKNRIRDIQQLDPPQAIELMRLLIVTGQAMSGVLNKNGVEIGRINYQDNGNWSVFSPEGPYQHFHLLGRAKSANVQPYGQACYFPHREEQPEFYQNLESLTSEDIRELRGEIIRLLSLRKFSDRRWGIKG